MNAAGRLRPRTWLITIWLACLVACGKSCSCGDAFLAQLETYKGEVQRDEARAVGAWSEVANGERFHIGDGLRTGKKGNAQLKLTGGGTALVESNTVLRFVDQDPRGKSRFDLEAGTIRIDSGEYDIDIATPRGIARMSKSSSVRVHSDDDGTQFDVLVGQVAIDQAGAIEQLAAGEKLELQGNEKLGDAKAEAEAEPANDPATPMPNGLSPPVRATTTGKQTAELSVPAEVESMTLHAPTLPVLFRVQTPSCAPNERPNADLDGKAAAAEPDGTGMLLSLGRPGAHRVNLRCDKRIVKQTTLHVIRDAATMELPKSANRVDVEADGRRYTVRYQNVIPVVSINWPSAAPGDYTLVLKRGSREQTYKSSKPTRDLPGVELMDGNYDFWFTSSSGQKSSVGGLRIEFDNTARALSLSEPLDGAVATGNEVAVSGVALLRTQVTANGVPLPLDPKGRFRAQVPLNAEKSVLVRASHPSAGVHYYLRRLH